MVQIAQYANTYFYTSMMEKMYSELFYVWYRYFLVSLLSAILISLHLIEVPRHNSHYFNSEYIIWHAHQGHNCRSTDMKSQKQLISHLFPPSQVAALELCSNNGRYLEILFKLIIDIGIRYKRNWFRISSAGSKPVPFVPVLYDPWTSV